MVAQVGWVTVCEYGTSAGTTRSVVRSVGLRPGGGSAPEGGSVVPLITDHRTTHRTLSLPKRSVVSGPWSAIRHTKELMPWRHALCKVEHQSECLFYLLHARRWCASRKVWTVSLGVEKSGGIQRANLKAEEYSVARKTGFLGCHADVRRIVTRHIPCVGANHHRDHERLAVDGVCRDHQDGPSPGLFPAVGGTEVDEVNLTAANHPSVRPPRQWRSPC